MLNNSIEGAMVVFGLITLLLNLFTFIGDVWQKKRRAILSLLFIAAVVSLLYLFLGNVVLECLFHGANMDGFFWGPT